MLDENKKKMLEFYNKGLELYHSRKFKEAREFFEKGLELVPDDGPCKIYIERCDYFIENPPPPDWDGVFTLETK